MNTTQPRPTKKQRRQRKRPAYPQLEPYQTVAVHREECGTNAGFVQSAQEPRRILRRKFVFTRFPGLTPRQMRNKYTPHVGKKQLAKQAA